MHHNNRILFYAVTVVFCILIFTGSAHAQTNLIPNPSFETADASGMPADWAKGKWGTNTAVFTYPVSGYSGQRGARVEISSLTSGDAKWYFKEIPVKPNTRYVFSDFYTSNVTTYITVQYHLTDGSFKWEDVAIPKPASGWTKSTATFITPSNVAGLTVFHLINRVGYLSVDNYALEESTRPRGLVSIVFDDGWKSTYENVLPILTSNTKLRSTFYLNSGYFGFPAYIDEAQVLNLQSAGQEIGAHTRHHLDLTALSPEQASEEVNGNIADLRAIGINNIQTFAYPFGAYNSAVETIIRSAGFIGARTSNGGVNGSSGDRFLLSRQGVVIDTSVEQVKAWIDDAIARDRWLILVFHHVDYSAESYSTTPERFREMMNYILTSKVPTATVASGVQRVYLR